MASVGLSDKGEHVILKGDTISGVSSLDTAAFTKYRRMMQRYANTMKPFSLKTIPRIGNNSFKDVMTFAQMGLKLR